MKIRRPDIAKLVRALMACLIAPALASCKPEAHQPSPGNQTLELRGSSSSFAAPAYWRWFNGLAVRENINADLSVMGSGESIQQFLSNQVDFAGTDSAPTAAEIQSARRGLLAFPVAAGAIAVAYHQPECNLKLTRAQLVQIFLGEIRDFKQLGCKPHPVTLLHRTDASGSTANVTATLASLSSAWKRNPGVGRQVNWPQGIGVRGSDGMAQKLLDTPGSIGYIEAAYVRPPLRAAALQDRSGAFHTPSSSSTAQALIQIKLDKKMLGSNPNPLNGYPIVSINWMLVPQRGLHQRAEGLRASLRYILSQAGQDDAELLGYAPIPLAIRERALKHLSEIKP
jgi:phosphate transport system substrate-binding protein